MSENEKGRFSKSSTLSVEAALPLEKPPSLTPRYLAVIARDSLQGTTAHFGERKFGFWPFFPKIVREASKQGANVIMFSSWSHDEHRLGPLFKKDLFPSGTHHSAVILGVKRHDGKKPMEYIEVWPRSRALPFRLQQYFATVSGSKKGKELLIQNLSRRQFGHAMLLLCGEANIVRTQRSKDKVYILDDFRFRSRLRNLRINLVLNPSHTYMHRPEMTRKRRAISVSARSLISVWNRGNPEKGSESKLPWVAFRNGKDITSEIKEILLPLELRHDVRMGIIRLA